MIKVIHGEAYFKPEDKQIILDLMKSQCSAMRSSYQAIHKHRLDLNNIRKYVKNNYSRFLNARYIYDAVMLAFSNPHEKVLFGGKRLWKKLQTGSITKQDWIQIRNNQLYSRGESNKDHFGNANIQCQKYDILKVNDPSQRGKWIQGKLFIPDKFKDFDHTCYTVRLIYKNDKFQTKISYEIDDPEIITAKTNGMIGIDTNPDGVALSETDQHGNLLKHFYIRKQRIQYAQKDKRDYDTRLLAKEVVDYAKSVGKDITLEKLKFKTNDKNKKKSKTKKAKKFNRMKSNFKHRGIIISIIARSKKDGVQTHLKNPAFTSVLGNLKYRKMYSLNSHTAAALVIARRGQGVKEKLNFKINKVKSRKTKKSKTISEKGPKFNLEGRGFKTVITHKSMNYLMLLGKSILATLTASGLVPDQLSGIGPSTGETPVSESYSITGRVGVDFLDKNQPGIRKSSF